jgi:hypothetical protein
MLLWYVSWPGWPLIPMPLYMDRHDLPDATAADIVVTPAQPPPHLVRVVTQLVEREPAGGA